MDGNLNCRHLKRVSGDISLAQVKFDGDRPMSSGFPLRRCNKETSIKLCAYEKSLPSAVILSRQRNLILKKCNTHQEQAKSCSGTSCETAETKCIMLDRPGSGYGERRKSTVLPLLPKTDDAYVVPTNTAVTSSETKSKNALSTEVCTINLEGKENPNITCRLEDSSSSASLAADGPPLSDESRYHRSINSELKSLHPRSSISSIVTHTNANSTTSTVEHTESTPVEEILITTATSLELPESISRNLLETRSENWSIKNQMVTAHSNVSSVWDVYSEIATDSLKASPCTFTGDGDKINNQVGIEQNRDVNTNNCPIVPQVPPTSPAGSLPDKPSFMLTFRKPKSRQRPRSIVTNSSSNKASLPSTASTPTPFSPITNALSMKPKLPNKLVVDNDENDNVNINHNANASNINNKNIADNNANAARDFSKPLTTTKSANLSMILKKNLINTGKVIKAFPAGYSYQSTNQVDPSSTNADASYYTSVSAADTVPPDYTGVSADPYPTAGAGGTEIETTTLEAPESTIYEPDASFWHSDSSTPSPPKASAPGESGKTTKPRPSHHKLNPHHVNKRLSKSTIKSGAGASSRKTESNSKARTSSLEDETESVSQTPATSAVSKEYSVDTYPPPTHTSVPYDSYYNNYLASQGSNQSSGPFLRTEKGAIRFHLPGRIQHKTTIKVAHFPTGEDKNIILNVKPDKEEDDCAEDSSPYGANNQNFIIPPSTGCPPYPFNPYGYGGCSPYSGPNYYGYYGYPPYY